MVSIVVEVLILPRPGHLIRMCFLSKARVAWDMFHLSPNPCSISFQSSGQVGQPHYGSA